MSLINSLLNIFVGNKSKKDLKEVESIVKDILSYDEQMSLLNHNELRKKTIEFKNQISAVKESNNKLISDFETKINSSENINVIDGLKIDFEKSWVQLRKSNTEPIIRIYSEAKTQELADKLANKFIKDISDKFL